MRKIDLTGRRFGMLKVFSEVARVSRNGRSRRVWKCQCDCGNWIDVIGEYLSRDVWRSCGCFVRPRAKRQPREYKGAGVNATNRLFQRYENQAKARDISFALSREVFSKMILDRCFYCDIAPISLWKSPSGNFQFTYNGVDRVDNTKGYEAGNVVTCCTFCNRGKSTLTVEQFMERIKRVYEKHILVNQGKEALREQIQRMGL